MVRPTLLKHDAVVCIGGPSTLYGRARAGHIHPVTLGGLFRSWIVSMLLPNSAWTPVPEYKANLFTHSPGEQFSHSSAPGLGWHRRPWPDATLLDSPGPLTYKRGLQTLEIPKTTLQLLPWSLRDNNTGFVPTLPSIIVPTFVASCTRFKWPIQAGIQSRNAGDRSIQQWPS